MGNVPAAVDTLRAKFAKLEHAVTSGRVDAHTAARLASRMTVTAGGHVWSLTYPDGTMLRDGAPVASRDRAISNPFSDEQLTSPPQASTGLPRTAPAPQPSPFPAVQASAHPFPPQEPPVGPHPPRIPDTSFPTSAPPVPETPVFPAAHGSFPADTSAGPAGVAGEARASFPPRGVASGSLTTESDPAPASPPAPAPGDPNYWPDDLADVPLPSPPPLGVPSVTHEPPWAPRASAQHASLETTTERRLTFDRSMTDTEPPHRSPEGPPVTGGAFAALWAGRGRWIGSAAAAMAANLIAQMLL